MRTWPATRDRGGFQAQIITFVAIYSCTNERDPRTSLKLKSVRRGPHAPADTCLLYGGVCLSSAEPIVVQEA